MTSQEKAIELFNKFYIEVLDRDGTSSMHRVEAKQCALIAVDEIIDAIDWHEYEVPNDQLKFWFEVKREIEKL